MRIYKAWSRIKNKCYNRKAERYKDYGRRGIKVCDEWKDNYKAFEKWYLENEKDGLQLGRIDIDGDFEPSNCKFVTSRDNLLNRRVLRENNKSGYQGVCFCNTHKKWKAQIMIKGKNKNLGYHFSKEEALMERNKYIRENNLQGKYKIQEIKE